MGAHWGLWSVFAASIVGRSGRVLSFEPSQAFRILEKNTANLPEVVRHNVAVGNDEGEMQFFGQGISSSGSLLESITELSRHHMPETPIEARTVKVLTLDSVWRQTKLAPTLIKIDVEGYERNVLDGARELIKHYQPTLLMEIHPGQLGMLGTSEEAVFDMLAGFGYSVITLDRNPNSIYTILAKASDGPSVPPR